MSRNVHSTQTFSRSTLTTSRMMDFFSEKELTAQTGHGRRDWGLVLAKELLDNAIDACEDSDIAPVVSVKVDQSGITVTDNGPGLPRHVVPDILDYSVKVSSREHYISPCRGSQGNALKTVVAMPFVLGARPGPVDIRAGGIRHEIQVGLDRIKQEPKIEHREYKDRLVKKGTSFKVYCPKSASYIFTAVPKRFLQLADNFAWLNPHLTLELDWFGKHHVVRATTKHWQKWLPSYACSPHWYPSLERLIAGYIGDDEAKGKDRTVREFLCQFAGLAGSAKQKAVLDATGLARMNLSSLRSGDGLDDRKLHSLLTAMKDHTRPIKPRTLGFIGRDHFEERFQSLGGKMETFEYRKDTGVANDLPWVLETAFGVMAAHFSKREEICERRVITGVNWSPSVSANPFRQLRNQSLDSVLEDQRITENQPVLFLLHVACPRVTYTDRGKSALVIEDHWDEDDDL